MASFLKTFLSLIFVFFSLICHKSESICLPDHADNPITNVSEVTALKRIELLQGETWDLESYTVGVCAIELSKIKSAGVVQKTSKGVVVLGRTNRTHAISGDNWALLVYRDGDNGTVAPCLGKNYTTELLFVCDTEEMQEGSAKLIEQEGCLFRFQIKTSILCPPEYQSPFILILVWAVFVFSLYCLAGIIYRRYKVRARGRQQIPNFPFWFKIGTNCANCCDWACRCEEEMVSTWDDDMDRDDTLLRP